MSMSIVGAHWIDGAWIPTTRSTSFEILSPHDRTVVGTAPDGGAEECAAAIAAARTAFRRSDWAHAPRLRAEVLAAMADRVAASADELARLLTIETGKLAAVARAEIAAAVSELRYYAGLSRAIAGRLVAVEPGVHSHLSREPAGVAGVITPWNAPAILLVRSLAPALAAGCTAVLKPAPQSSLFHTAFVRALSEAPGLPDGVVNSFCEQGSAGGAAMVRSPDVDVVSFTGSSAVGKRIMADAAGTLKRLNLELGGKASAIVFPDVDVAAVAPALAAAGMILAGQQCTAANRVLVHESIHGALTDALAAALRALRVGRSDEEGTAIGPLIDPRSRDRVAALVEANAARAVLHGRIPGGALARGGYLEPSLLAVEDLASPVVQEEFFGPVMNIERFATEEEAVERADATSYGLAASVWTRDLDRGFRVARALRSGTVWLNDHNKLFPEVETGGVRDSGYGRLHGPDGLNEFLSAKHVYHRMGRLAV
ncbi:aldehyde dehydrogenase family protein [Azospirillum sp. ST 5-10]|uniref:aldehyde dehydrogenase family protein n=1 Tax=unclassified Azospirillum TaxID=2630922 RepID=UPI003F4A66C4